MSPQAARLPQRFPPTSFPCPTLTLWAFLAAQRNRSGSVLRFALTLRVRRDSPVAWDRCQAAIGAASSEKAKP
jgi:hypothetical protein